MGQDELLQGDSEVERLLKERKASKSGIKKRVEKVAGSDVVGKTGNKPVEKPVIDNNSGQTEKPNSGQ